MTYALLSLAVLAVLAAVTVPTLGRLPLSPLAATALVLVALTVVFDNVIVGVGIVAYDDALISGWRMPTAPVEDLAYAVGAVLIVPALWTWLGRRGVEAADDGPSATRAAVGSASGDPSATAAGPSLAVTPSRRTTEAGPSSAVPPEPSDRWRQANAPQSQGAPVIARIVRASRPVSWINTAYPFAAGYLMATREIDATLIVGTLFFLVPYNLLMYGVNDVFDYESDLANPRKGGIEGDVVRDRDTARHVHRAILVACATTVVPPLAWLLTQGSAGARVTLVLVVAGVLAYSVPVLRFKERPFLDSATSALHFAGPLLYALVLAGSGLTSRAVWPIWAAFIAWGMASHAFGAVQDVRADREGGIGSVATVIGARATVWFAMALYAAASAVLLVLPWPGVLAAALPLAYAVSIARFALVTDATCEEANRGWRTFLWLNQPVGFLVTLLLIVEWNDWL